MQRRFHTLQPCVLLSQRRCARECCWVAGDLLDWLNRILVPLLRLCLPNEFALIAPAPGAWVCEFLCPFVDTGDAALAAHGHCARTQRGLLVSMVQPRSDSSGRMVERF